MSDDLLQRDFVCPVCGERLQEHTGVAACSFCEKAEKADLVCPHGHYQCEQCRLAGPSEIIERVCRHTRSSDPVEIVNLVMRHPSFNDHGCEHHELVAPAVLASLENRGLARVDQAMVRRAMKRTQGIPYGACGSLGACGACVSAGVAISLLSKATFRSDRERALTLTATSSALQRLADMGGARCCKQSVYAALEAAMHMMEATLGLSLWKRDAIRCLFSRDVDDCKQERCPYYEG